jgi:hypothetical protein
MRPGLRAAIAAATARLAAAGVEDAGRDARLLVALRSGSRPTGSSCTRT